jgi:redox-sensitive bicupin YhaK (pirin superfamily)
MGIGGKSGAVVLPPHSYRAFETISIFLEGKIHRYDL